MHHLTRYYKNLCEQLQEKINILEKRVLLERPSIEDQIETGVSAIDDVETGRSKGRAKAGNVVVPFDIGYDPSLPSSLRGKFRSPGMSIYQHLNPDVFGEKTKKLQGSVSLNPEKVKLIMDPNNPKSFSDYIDAADTIAHEAGGHAHQLAAKARDAEKRVAQAKTTYANVEMKKALEDYEKGETSAKTPKADSYAEKAKNFSRYYFDPDEINARSAGAGTTAYKLRKAGAAREAASNVARTKSEIDLDYTAGGEKVSPEETAAMTRHEKSVAKRNQVIARKDLRSAAARGIQKAELEQKPFSADEALAKERQKEIQRRVESLKGEKTQPMAVPEQPKVSIPEPTPTKPAKIASGFIDPVSATIQATTNQATKVAPQVATKPLPGTQIKGVGTGLSVAAGVVGGLAGEYVVKPAAEKAGVFKAVETGTRETLSRMPDWAANAADIGLNVAQGILDPLGSYNQFLANQARKSKPMTSKGREEAQARYDKQNF